MNNEKILSDAIFGFITLKPHIIVIIDTPEFQRLRCISQLGVVPFVYPTADHSRFEHSIGTYWLASKLVTQIQQQLRKEDAEIQISDEDVMCVEIAALCHDIGHGPFSHFWDKTFLPAIFGNNFKKHEKQFSEMWKVLMQNKKVEQMVKKYSLDEKLIADLINGEGKEILCDIVSNSESGMDVDKWDYLARDSAYLGHSSTNYRADIERMIHFARANKDSRDNKWRISFRDSEGLNMFRVFHLRHYLYKTAYHHRTVVAIDQMLLDGCRQCIDKNLLSRDKISNPEWIIENTDAIFWSNFNSIHLFKRILNRDLYRPILEAVKYEINLNKVLIKAECLGPQYENNENIRFVFCEFKLGNGDTNPMHNIYFYNKNSKKTSFQYDNKLHMLPPHLNMDCNESKIMVFSTLSNESGDFRHNNDILEIKNRITEYLNLNNWTIQNIK